MTTKLGFYALLGLAAFAGSANANLVSNGGFEKPGGTVPPGLYLNYLAGQSFPGWTVGAGLPTDPLIDPGVDIHDTGHTAAHSGQYSLDIAGRYSPGAISQTLHTTVGAIYQIDLWYAGHPYHPYEGLAMANVNWDGTTLDTLAIAPAPGTQNMNWTHFQTTVTATSSHTDFELYGLTLNGSVIFDDISVERIGGATAPDAGSSMLLLGIGAAALVAARRKKSVRSV